MRQMSPAVIRIASKASIDMSASGLARFAGRSRVRAFARSGVLRFAIAPVHCSSTARTRELANARTRERIARNALTLHGLEVPLRQAEDGRRQRDARLFDLGHELGAHTGGLDGADDLAVLVRLLLEQEHVLKGDLVALHALHLGDVRDLARPVAHAALLA